ncbi:MAG: single-stranded-DNA-specific exonuclease RecJ [Granulosicoccus sp.]
MSTATRIVRRPAVADPLPLHTSALANRLLAARGVTESDALDFSLGSLPTPESLTGIDVAVTRLLQARNTGEHILVVGDYDCDGATSTVVALSGLTSLGFSSLDYLVPNRFDMGYGLSPAIVDCACDSNRGAKKPDLILTVDNGVASVDGVERARECGIDVVVTDHHLPPAVLPRAVAIVNPNMPDATFPSGNLAGVGVMFYVLLALRGELKRRGDRHANTQLAALLDLVAIGTVADVVPLDSVNRVLVEQGLRRMRAGYSRPGVQALLRVAGRSIEQTTSADIGFTLGPRLNAAGRLADMRAGIECLLSADESTALRLALELDALNRSRRLIEQDMRSDADQQLQQLSAEGALGGVPTFATVLFDPAWHQGVIGILAGRLKEQLHRPAVVFTADGDTGIKGSARSIPGVHIRDVLQAIVAHRPGLLEKFGGHAMAAGMSLPRARLAEFSEAFETEVSRVLQGKLPAREWCTDGALDAAERTLDNALMLQWLMPWGQGLPIPMFDDVFDVHDSRIVGSGHLKLRVQDAAAGGAVVDAIAFNCQDALQAGDRVRLVYSLSVNTWRERQSLQLLVNYLELDAALA